MIDQHYKTLLLTEPASQVLRIELNRPQNANAFNTAMAIELYSLFESIALNVDKYRCVILTGSGSRAFCAGGDLKERLNMSDETPHKALVLR